MLKSKSNPRLKAAPQMPGHKCQATNAGEAEGKQTSTEIAPGKGGKETL